MKETNSCKNCDATLIENPKFCGACGQKVITKQFTVKDLFLQMFSIITNLESHHIATPPARNGNFDRIRFRRVL